MAKTNLKTSIGFIHLFFPCVIFILCCILYSSAKADILTFEMDRPLFVGSRPLSMGNAFISIVDNAEAGFWNPAGLIQQQGVRIFFAGEIWDREDNVFDAKCIAYCYRNNAFFWGNKLALRVDDGGTPDFTYYSYAYKLNSYLATGFSIKFKRKHPSDYYQFFGYDPAYDLGFLLKANNDNSAGLLIQKLSGKGQWVNIINIGFSHKVYEDILASVDLSFLFNDRKFEPHLGWEYNVTKWLAMRVGVSDKSPTAGFGLKAGRLRIDTAFIRIKDQPSAFLSVQFQL